MKIVTRIYFQICEKVIKFILKLFRSAIKMNESAYFVSRNIFAINSRNELEVAEKCCL